MKKCFLILSCGSFGVGYCLDFGWDGVDWGGKGIGDCNDCVVWFGCCFGVGSLLDFEEGVENGVGVFLRLCGNLLVGGLEGNWDFGRNKGFNGSRGCNGICGMWL